MYRVTVFVGAFKELTIFQLPSLLFANFIFVHRGDQSLIFVHHGDQNLIFVHRGDQNFICVRRGDQTDSLPESVGVCVGCRYWL